MRIAFRLTVAFLAIASLVALAGYVGQRTSYQVRRQLERLRERAVRTMDAATDVSLALDSNQLRAYQFLTVGRRLPEDWSINVTDLLSTQEPRSYDRLKMELAEHEQLMREFSDRANTDKAAAEEFLETEVRSHFEGHLLPLLEDIRQQAEREFTSGIRNSERTLIAADQQRGLILVAAALAAVSIGLLMARWIGKPLYQLRQVAQKLGQGRLESRAAIRSRDEIGDLAATINQMAADLQEKTVSKNYLNGIIESMREMLLVTGPDLQIQYANPAVCRELDRAPKELMNQPLGELLNADDLSAERGPPIEPVSDAEGWMRAQSGEYIPVHFSLAEMLDDDERPSGVVVVASNISRQKESERRLRDSLREKEVLLKEVHHRVKNNLQVISSLLNLQANELHDPDMLRVLRESQMRVRSMALIHEQLYRSDDLVHIDFADYTSELVEHLKRTLGSRSERIQLSLDICPLRLSLDLAIPCGMIVNELVCNALEHAFPENRTGEICVRFRRDDDTCRLTVADTGVGMQGSFSSERATTMGLKVVQALTRQIHGRLEHACQGGSVFTVSFPSAEGPVTTC